MKVIYLLFVMKEAIFLRIELYFIIYNSCLKTKIILVLELYFLKVFKCLKNNKFRIIFFNNYFNNLI